jgi:hypothetical protein
LAPQHGGTVRYNRFGEAPNREFVVAYESIPHANGLFPASFQIIIHQDGAAEVHCERCISDGTTHTQGIEDETGTIGISLPGRNLANFSLIENAVVFRTDGVPDPEARWSVVGTALKDGDATGHILVEALLDDDVVKSAVLPDGGVYSISTLSDGEYVIRATLDANRNGRVDDSEVSERVEITLPPDALGIDFDFRTSTPADDAGMDASVDTGTEEDILTEDVAIDQPDETDDAPATDDDGAQDDTGGGGEPAPPTVQDDGGCQIGAAPSTLGVRTALAWFGIRDRGGR